MVQTVARQWPALPEATPQSLALWARQITRLLQNNTLAQSGDLGTMASQDANDVAITGGSIAGAAIDDGAIGTAKIADDAVTYAKIQNVSATSRLLGRITSGAGNVEELTGTQATTLLNLFTSALKGLVPASSGGTVNFLRADGTFAAPHIAHVQTNTPSGAGNSDFTSIPAGTDALLLIGSNLTVSTDGARIDLRMSQAASFLAGASDYGWNLAAGNFAAAPSGNGDAADNEITVAIDVGNAAGEYAEFYLLILRPLASGSHKSCFGFVTWRNAAGSYIYGYINGHLLANTNAIDGLRILPSAGNISGVLELWALKS